MLRKIILLASCVLLLASLAGCGAPITGGYGYNDYYNYPPYWYDPFDSDYYYHHHHHHHHHPHTIPAYPILPPQTRPAIPLEPSHPVHTIPATPLRPSMPHNMHMRTIHPAMHMAPAMHMHPSMHSAPMHTMTPAHK